MVDVSVSVVDYFYCRAVNLRDDPNARRVCLCIFISWQLFIWSCYILCQHLVDCPLGYYNGLHCKQTDIFKSLSVSLKDHVIWEFFYQSNNIKNLYTKIFQNWYNKLSCVNERIHSWLMWPVNFSHRECTSAFLYYTLGVICRFYKWDF